MKKYILICLSLFCFVMPILAETTSSSTFPPDTTVAQQAIASPDYIVTAGDIYALAMDGTVISVTIDASYKLRVGNLGVINVKGLTFQQLKNKVENLVNSNYPTANFQFYITNPASFKVLITGEVVVSGEVDTWSLKRLSTLIQNYLTPYSSTRIIVIESEDGTKKTYDLFQAKRYGDMSQDPYLRPNDKIIISEYDRIVTVKGEVKRPGTYELLPEEQIQDLINVYGGGYTDFANKSEMILTRFIGGEQVWEQKNLVEADFVADKVLFSRDVVQVLSHSLTRNAFFVEGSIVIEEDLVYNRDDGTLEKRYDGTLEKRYDGTLEKRYDGTVYEPATFVRTSVEYVVGESYVNFVRNNKAWFVNNSADLENAYIRRTIQDDNSDQKEEIVNINLKKIIYGSGFYEDLLIQPNDVLYVPFIQYFVTVNGAVNASGRIPYVPGKKYEYYVNLAGGFDVNRNVFDSVVIKTKDGKKLSKKSVIPPEAIITAKANSPSGGWLMPIIISILTLISTVLTCFVSIHDLGWI